jgi:1-acyl-sn-glycerol-3-phosphate acyltransferase
MKDTMQADPMVDVYFHRLPASFIDPTPVHGAPVEAAIADLAGDLDIEDALLIFPEGGNFTPQRRRRAISRLRQRGHTTYAERAEAMVHVMPPKPGGVGAAIAAAPHADVVFVAHTGLEHIVGVRDAWREIPVDKTLHLRWWFYPAAEVPVSEAERLGWLFERWADIDTWIATHHE